MEWKGCESIIHDHDLWVTMVGWEDVLYSDWDDFRRRRAISISNSTLFSQIDTSDPPMTVALHKMGRIHFLWQGKFVLAGRVQFS